MKKVKVSASKVYDVTIGRGLLPTVGQVVREVLHTSGCAAIITDDIVDSLYGECVAASLEQTGYRVVKFVMPNGEKSKSAETLVQIWEFLAENGLIRSDVIVALGGGVVGDIAGFAASSYMRGIHFVQVPTTLLAMVDSSVGGKTAINLAAGKNLAGAFYQPEAVICDLDVLKSLDEKIYADGCAEIIKYGVIRDAELFGRLETEMPRSVHAICELESEKQNLVDAICDLDSRPNGESVGCLDDNFQILEEVVARCVEIKADVVNADERDTGVRQLLNFGHTIGHAFEAISGFEISHGSAVALGMSLICKLASAQGMCDGSVAERVDDILEAYGLPTDYERDFAEKYDFSTENIARHMASDKKHVDDYANLIVPKSLGECVIRKTSDAEVDEWVRRL